MPPNSYIWQGPTFWQGWYPPYSRNSKVFAYHGAKYVCFYVIRETWRQWLEDHSLPLTSCPINHLFTTDLLQLVEEGVPKAAPGDAAAAADSADAGEGILPGPAKKKPKT